MLETIITILFFALPVATLAFLGIGIYRYAYAKRKNKKVPDTFPPSEIKMRKTVLIIASVLAAVFFAVVIGFIILLYFALAHM